MREKRVSDDTIFDGDVFFSSEPVVIDEEEDFFNDSKALDDEYDTVITEDNAQDFVSEKEIYEVAPVVDEIIVKDIPLDGENSNDRELEDSGEIDYTFFDLPKKKQKALSKQYEKNKTAKKVIEPTQEEEFSDEEDKKTEMIVEPQTKVKPRKRRNPIAILFNICAFFIFLFIVFETAVAFLNFNLIKQNKEPTFLVTTSKEKRGEFDYTIHDMGLFKIVRKENAKEYEVKLLPFFLDI